MEIVWDGLETTKYFRYKPPADFSDCLAINMDRI